MTTTTPEAPAKKAQVGITHEALLKANMSAKAQFADKYEGASIKLSTKLHNRAVIRAFKRIFHISMRNWYIATNTPRTTLGDSALASKVEAGMLLKIKSVTDHFTTEINGAKALAGDADVDFNLISHGTEYVEEVRVIGPVSMKMREMFMLADKLMDLQGALYAFGVIQSEAVNNTTYDVKKKLEACATSIRNFRTMSLNKVNESGKAREGFKAVDSEGQTPTQQTAAPLEGTVAPQKVVGIESAGGSQFVEANNDDAMAKAA